VLRLAVEVAQTQALIVKCSTEMAFVMREVELGASSQLEEQALVSWIYY
jgi:hypothetical protein